MIIVEGPDGSGKTTLVQKLAERFNLPISPKLVNPDMSATMSKKAWCEDNVSRGFQMRLFDRHCLISEPIYNSITKPAFDPGFDDVEWYSVMNTMLYLSCRPLIIYCLPDYQTVRHNILNGDVDQPKRVKEGVRKIYAQYVAKAASDVPLAGAMIYDYEKHGISHIYRFLDHSLEKL